MLAHAYQGSTKPEPIDLNAMIDQSLTLSYQSYRKKDARFNLTIHKAFDSGLQQLECFPGDLIRVFVNIIDNSCYALLMKLKEEPDGFIPTIDIKTQQEGDSVNIIMRDNGHGIPKANLDKLFQPFFTTKPTGTGTGLGLSIVYDIITKQHGGQISVESTENKFTEINITLPLHVHVALPEAA